MAIINHYSMLWSGIILFGLVAFWMLRKGFTAKDGIKLVVLSIGLVILWLFLRPQQASITEIQQLQAQIGEGQAVLLELQSPY